MATIKNKAAILTIGDELMIGQTVDTNSAWMARWLDSHGWRIAWRTSCGDTLEAIRDGIGQCLERADLVLLSGGLGPTNDDRTVEALCAYFKCDSVWHEPTWKRMADILRTYHREPTDMHRKQCYLPSIAVPVANDRGTAPGLLIEQDGKRLVSMPGVPSEMKHLLDEKIGPMLPSPGYVEHRFVRTAGEGESVIAEKVADIESALPAYVHLAYLPSFGAVTLRLSVYEAGHSSVLDQLQKEIAARLGHLVYSLGMDNLSAVIGQVLRERNQTLATAESCTGGYLAHLITAEAGSSDYYLGSVIAYANTIKTRLLEVNVHDLTMAGAVSEEVVGEMAQGARHRLGADWALATSGIAGPGGATPAKPVGTVCLACAGPNGVRTRTVHFRRDRAGNIESASVAALTMLWRALTRSEE